MSHFGGTETFPTLPPAAPAAPAPAFAGRYELGEELARGGMGAVYRATDLALGREVAVKLMREEFRDTPDSVRRFLDEAHITGQLQHPGIPPVFEVGRLADGSPYLAMKLIKGRTLRDLLRDRADVADDRPRFVAAFEQVAQAVGYAHAHGVLHRDLKPGNVMVGAFGEVQVMDWGVAKIVAAGKRTPDADDPDATLATAITTATDPDDRTRAGSVLGTPAYMPPEQAVGALDDVDARSDVFGLGAILCVILTGRPPYVGGVAGDTRTQAARGLLGDAWTRLDACGAEPELVALCRRCLSPDRGDRPADGDAVARAVAALRAAADERARRAELDRATAEARAAEELARRRLAEREAAARHRVLRLQLAVAALALLVAGVAGAAFAWQDRRERLAEAERVRQVRAERAAALVRSLGAADTASIPAIADELAELGDAARPALDALAATPTDSPARRHARLALLRTGPEWAADAAEGVGRFAPHQVAAVAELLKPHANAVAGGVWARLLDANRPAGDRLRAAALAAAFAPDDPRWERAAPDLAAALAADNPLHAGHWADALRPARRWLVAALAEVVRAPGSGETPRLVAAGVLAGTAADDQERLAELALDAGPAPFRVLLAALAPAGDRAAAPFEAELRRGCTADWAVANATFADPPPAARAALEAAGGAVTGRFAFAPSLPAADLPTLMGALGAAGYRPLSVRPHDAAGAPRVAAAWRRDGRKWDWHPGGPADEVRRRDAANRANGLLPLDAAQVPDQPGAPRRFAAVWGEPLPGMIDGRMYVDIPDGRHKEYWEPLNALGFVPRSNVLSRGPAGEPFRTSVRWRLRGVGAEYRDPWEEAGPANDPGADWFQADARFAGSSGGLAAVWWHCGGREARVFGPAQAGELRAWAAKVAADGFWPLSVSAYCPAGGECVALSVWERPVPDEATRDESARRHAAAAAGLFHLGRPAPAWEMLRAEPEPRRRGWLVHSLAETRAHPAALLRRLDVEPEPSVRRALLWTLADVPPAEAPGAAKAAAGLFRAEPDPGVHSAAALLLRRHGAEAPAEEPAAGRRLVTSEGHVLAVVPGPAEFRMGSPAGEPQRRPSQEVAHAVRVGRTFAIGTHEVTLAQFRRYRPDHPAADDYTPTGDCPVTSVAWFDAAAYCRWLGEREGLPESEQCYPPEDELRPGMRLPADFLRRKGYRLPTEAEWELACRAGAATSRPYGTAESLLAGHAWTAANSGYRASPVGRLRPNDWGLFDALGNAMEWCHDRHRDYRAPPGPTQQDEPGEEVVDYSSRVRRGGSFLHQPSDARAAQRDPAYPLSRHPFQGFRVARTVD